MTECMDYFKRVSVCVVVDNFPDRICSLVFPAFDYRKLCCLADDDTGRDSCAACSGIGLCRHLIDIVAVILDIGVFEFLLCQIGGKKLVARLTDNTV